MHYFYTFVKGEQGREVTKHVTVYYSGWRWIENNEKLHFVINVWPFTRRECKCGVAVFGTSHPVFAKGWWLPLPLNFIHRRKGLIWLAKSHVQKQTINTFSWWTKLEYRIVTHNWLILKTNSLLFFLKVSRQLVIWMTEVWINSVLL